MQKECNIPHDLSTIYASDTLCTYPAGLSFSLEVNDEDLGLTCPLGVSGPPARCPCSVVQYRLVSSELGADAVHLDPETGVVTVTDHRKLDCSRRYRLQIEAHGEERDRRRPGAPRGRGRGVWRAVFCSIK